MGIILNALPSYIKEALLGSHVAFILRGWPGLGRVMQGLSLSQILKIANPSQNQIFYSSEQGLRFLKELGHRVIDIGTSVVEDILLGGVGNSKVYSLMEEMDKRPPSAVIIDGELQLMPALKSNYSGPIIALANAFDIFNPSHSTGKRLIFRSFYHNCDFVIVGSFSQASELYMPPAFPQVLWLPPLVRSEILNRSNFGFSDEAEDIVVVLGGGSHGAIPLREINNKIIDGVYQIASINQNRKFTVFGDDNGDLRRTGNIFYGTPSGCLSAIVRSHLVIGRSGRNLIAEVLALKKHAILVSPLNTGSESDIHRSVEQQENANIAARLSTQIRLWDGKCIEKLRKIVEISIMDEPATVNWVPGNVILEKALSG